MTIRSLAEVGARLEEAVSLLPGSPDSPQELYDRYEEMAIAMLDSEFIDWPENALEDYLDAFLRLKDLELGDVAASPSSGHISNTVPG